MNYAKDCLRLTTSQSALITTRGVRIDLQSGTLCGKGR